MPLAVFKRASMIFGVQYGISKAKNALFNEDTKRSPEVPSFTGGERGVKRLC